MIKIVKQGIKTSLQSNTSKLFVVILTLIFLSLYIFAVELTSGIRVYQILRSNEYIAADLIISLVNSALIALSIMMFINIFTLKRATEQSYLQSLTAMFFSFATTGCYVCGTVLLQTLGLAASLAALPLGGLEIKVLTALLMGYSIYGLSKSVLGICQVRKSKIFAVVYGEHMKLNFTLPQLGTVRSILITSGFVVLIYSLPIFLGGIQTDLNSVNAEGYCPVHEVTQL